MKNILPILCLTIGVGVSAFAGVKSFESKKPLEVKAESTSDDYAVYRNEDLGFATRNPSDSRIVLGDIDGGMQTKGNVVGEKSELRLYFKRTISNYWFGVGGFTIYSSSDTTIRFLYLSYNSNGAYGRTAEKTNLVLKSYDGSKELTTAYGDGKLFSDYTSFGIKFDLTDRNAAKVSLKVSYGGEVYYPFEGSTRLDTVTYTHKPSGFPDEYKYAAMAGANATDSGVSLLKFNTQSEADLGSKISEVQRTFSYSRIGDFIVKFKLSSQITYYNGYLNDHLTEWLDDGMNPVDISNGVLINGKPFKYWVDFTEENMIIDTSSEHGVHEFPMYAGSKYAPVTFKISSTSMTFTFNTAYIPSDSIVITFKAGVFSGYVAATRFTLANDLTYHATLKTDSSVGTVGTNVEVKTSVDESTGNYSITNAADNGEKTASQGAKFRKYTLWTNIPRNTAINQAYPHDHYRYMFENILLNDLPLQYFNVWGRANNKDFTDLSTPTMNYDYELDHPASGIKYNMVTYLSIATDQPNYVLFVEIPYKLMDDFGFTSYDFKLRDGSAWFTTEGVKRINMLPEDKYAVTNFVDGYMHFEDVDPSSTSDTGACKGEAGYYLTAKKAFNTLTDSQKTIFQVNENTKEFVLARARYEAWARACGDASPYDGNNSIMNSLSLNLGIGSEDDKTSMYFISSLAIGAFTLMVLLVLIKKKRIKK